MKFRPGILSGKETTELYDYARDHEFAIPAVNVIGTSSINAALETARDVQSPIIIQFSNVGSHFIAGFGLSDDHREASIAGAVSAAHHVRQIAELYGVAVVLHTDHADRKLLTWVDGLLEENRKYHEQTGDALFSSHMLDLSAEDLSWNIETCCLYLKKMKEMDLGLGMELGVTGGVEDGFDHSDADQSELYTQPEEVARAWEQLSQVSPDFTIAASFGNVHGVYKPDDVILNPRILLQSQDLIHKKFGSDTKPVKFVFHGGSGSSRAEIREAISYGTVKMNINTDLQWAFWVGIRDFYEQNKVFMQSQIGNPQSGDQPNKSWYNPQVWLREGEKHVVMRLRKYFEDLNCMKRNT